MTNSLTAWLISSWGHQVIRMLFPPNIQSILFGLVCAALEQELLQGAGVVLELLQASGTVAHLRSSVMFNFQIYWVTSLLDVWSVIPALLTEPSHHDFVSNLASSLSPRPTARQQSGWATTQGPWLMWVWLCCSICWIAFILFYLFIYFLQDSSHRVFQFSLGFLSPI